MSREPRIELVSRRLVCRNALFDVFLDEIADDQGRRVPDYLSVVPVATNAEGFTGIAVLPVSDGKLGLMRVYRHPQGAAAWEIPKGFIEAGEDAAAAASRELQEETGLRAKSTDMVDLGSLAPVPGIVKARVRLFAALKLDVSEAPAGELGHDTLQFFTEAQAFAMASAGAIEEPCTLLAMYRLRDRREP